MNARMTAAAALAAMLLAAGGAVADVRNMGPGLTSLETVHVGNPGNAGDTRYHGISVGAVSYTYNIGKYEVTAGQYTEFLNAVAGVDTYGLYNTDMWSHQYGCKIELYAGSGTVYDPYQYRVASDRANRPVNFLTWGDAARFTNWLTNGQPTGLQVAGTSESGSYALNGATTNAQLLTVTRITDADRIAGKMYYFIPSEDEWYKAAYYNPATGSYYNYPTSSNSLPSNELIDPDPGNNATFWRNGYTIGSPYYRTQVGAHENSGSPYGTFDQGGNVWEWNEAVRYETYRGLRGESFGDSGGGGSYMLASFQSECRPGLETSGIGFRVSEVPEPGSMAVLALGVLGVLRRRRHSVRRP